MLALKVLIIDDMCEDREAVRIALRKDTRVKYEVIEAASGTEGLEILKDQLATIDLAFLDFQLSDMDAHSFLDRLLGNDEVAPLPIVVLTGSLPPDHKRLESMKRGVQDFITKSEATSTIVSRIGQNAIERHRLLQRVVASERESLEAFEKAARADRAKSQFLALVSHELRTPLTAILGFCRILQQNPDCEQRDDMLRTVVDSGEHLEELLNDLIDIVKVESGTLELDPTDFDPRELVHSTLLLLGKRATDKGIQLNHNIDASTPQMIHADPVRIRQILVNLVGNAIKFTDVGSVQTKVKWDELTGDLRMRVEDTGIGVAPEIASSLFSPFKKAGANFERNREGVGLGLAISRQLCKMMGGDLRLESTSDQGSAFVAIIKSPRATALSPGPSEETRGLVSIDLTGKRIFVADDVRANRYLIKQLLTGTSAELSIFENGSAVLEQIGTPENPNADLLILDMLMPVMDGYETTKQLRSRGFKLPIVALTAAATSMDHQICLEAGCDLVLTKPIDVPTLLTALGKSLNVPST